MHPHDPTFQDLRAPEYYLGEEKVWEGKKPSRKVCLKKEPHPIRSKGNKRPVVKSAERGMGGGRKIGFSIN